MSQHPQQPAESGPHGPASFSQLNACFTLLPDAIVVWDQTGTICSLNAAACALFEVSAPDVVGTPVKPFLGRYGWWDEQHRPFFFPSDLLDPVTGKEEAPASPGKHPLILSLPSNRTVSLDLRFAPIPDAGGQPMGVLVAFRELPSRYHQALHLQRVYSAIVTFNQAIERMFEELPPALPEESFLFTPSVLLMGQQLVDLIQEVLECWRVSLLAFSSATLHLSYVVGSGFTTEQKRVRQQRRGHLLLTDVADETVLTHLLANQEVILTPDQLHLPSEEWADMGTATLLVIPLFLKQRLIGGLVIHKQGRESEYSREEIDLVRAVADHALLLIEGLDSLPRDAGGMIRELVLSELDQLSNTFLILANHELRTPLTGIKGHLQLAQHRLARLKRALSNRAEDLHEPVEQTRRSLEAAEGGVRLQERMLQNIIDDMRLQANRLVLSLTPCDLVSLLTQVVEKQQASAPARTIHLEMQTHEPTIPVLADAGRMIQVLTIYLSNALSHGPEEQPVTVRVQIKDSFARVSVHGEGAGISPREQSQLWKRFYRGKESTVQHELDLSLGLGFYLCKALIERHHGTVGVESAPNQGTTFWLAVPLARATEETRPHSRRDPPSFSGEQREKRISPEKDGGSPLLNPLDDTGLQSKEWGERSGKTPAHSGDAEPETLPSLTRNILALLIEQTPDALLVVDSVGAIILVNVPGSMLFGYSRDELMGQLVERLLPERLRAAHTVHRMGYVQAAHARPMGIGLDLVGRRKDGTEFPVDISLRPILIEHTLHVQVAIRDMTAQRESEREHLQIAERIRQQDKLLSLSHDAILVCDAGSHILSWNKGAERLYGWTAQEVVGKDTHALLQTHFPISQEMEEQTLERYGQWQGELVHTCRDGRQVIVESRRVLTRDDQGKPTAILEINRDMTERRRLEQLEQKAREEREAHLHVLQVLLDHLSSGVFLVQGPHLRLLMANQAASGLWGASWPLGQPKEEFLRQQDVCFFTANGRPLAPHDLPARRAMATGEPVFQDQLVICQPNGTRLPVLADAIPLEGLHLLPRFSQEMTPARDLAERVVLEVYQDVTALRENEGIKDQFISLATHELGTPVTIIAGYADHLLSRAVHGKGHELDDWQRAKLREMKQATRQLATLIEELLNVTRVQAGQFQLERRSTDLVALAQKVVTQLQETTQRHRLSFQTAFSQLWALVDTFRIEQVLSNLLSNAIKYSPDGGSIEVTLEKNAEAPEACFRIRDQGLGIPRDQQALLFGRFVRADNVRATGIRGTGLGLYLCRELVERHGGRIWFDSEERVGSTFCFSIPCGEPSSR